MVLGSEPAGLKSFLDKEYNLAVIINVNKKLFNFVSAVSTYIKTFTFGKKRIQVQIKAIENSKSKISLKTIAFATLATRFLKDNL